MLDLQSNPITNGSFVSDTPQDYASVGVSLFKDSSLMGTFPLPLPKVTSAPIHRMSSVTSESLGSYDPWVVPRPSKIKSYGAKMSLSPVDVSYSVI